MDDKTSKVIALHLLQIQLQLEIEVATHKKK